MPRPPRQLKSQELQQQILKLFSKNSKLKFDAKQIAKKLNVANPPATIAAELHKMAVKNLIFTKDHVQYAGLRIDNAPTKTPKTFRGYVDMTRSGAAYITQTHAQDDIYVPAKGLNGAFHQDFVEVTLNKSGRNKRPEGKIVSIIKRGITQVIGTVRILKNFGVVQVNSPKHFPEVCFSLKQVSENLEGEVVKIEITEWGKGQNKPIWGKVIEKLDKGDQNEIAMQNILLSHGFEMNFSEEAMEEAKTLAAKINPTETKKRKDFRKHVCFTIDPATAKDFDDALSIKILENGRYEIGVHIADVTHFLDEGTTLDKEAFARSTSVYIADRVCPMLPEALSNHLCSLVPEEDRYTFSAVFEMDDNGKVYDAWYGKTVIHSKRRFSYEEAQERIESGEGDFATEIQTLNNISRKLRAHRFDNGSINFDSDEVQFTFDDKMVPIAIRVKERKEAHMMIEDFMLLANRRVAEFVYRKSAPAIPFVYRVHDLPNPDKLADFSRYAKELGFSFNTKSPTAITDSFNRLAEAMHGNDVLKLLEPLAIRTMSKAEYTPENIGHYGLGFDFYTHFTSPIRRYADVMVHRILFENLGKETRRSPETLEKMTKHISLQERKAMDAERESIKYKLAEYMSYHIGEVYDGMISGIIEKGIFIEILATKAEGFIPFDDLPGHYTVSEDRFRTYGKKGGDDLHMGKKVTVKVLDADPPNQKVILEIISFK